MLCFLQEDFGAGSTSRVLRVKGSFCEKRVASDGFERIVRASRVTVMRNYNERSNSSQKYLQEETQMRNLKVTRIACLLLAVLFLVSAAVVSVGASSEKKDPTISIEDYVDVLKTISYERYREIYVDYFNSYKNATTTKLDFSALEGLIFEDAYGNVIEIHGNSWKMTKKDGTVYNSVEEAVSKGEKQADLVYQMTIEGVPCIYTPDHGSVTWSLDFAGKGVTGAGLYSILLEYYPIEGKAASAEREFSVNGEVPFAEARALALPKIWSAFQANGVSKLDAVYTLTKKDTLSAIEAEAKEAGILYEVAQDQKSLIFVKPDVMTEKLSNFISKYELRFFILDANNNELRPAVKQTPEWSTYTMRDSEGYYSEAFGFVFDPTVNGGSVDVSLKGVNEAIAISNIVLVPYDELQSYDSYLANLINNNVGTAQGGSIIKIEGEDTMHTSTNVVYPVQDNSSALTSPVDSDRTVLNTIGTNSTGAEKWAVPGQWIEYSFTVDSSGMYDIYTRFKQSYLDGMYVSRALYVYTNYETEADYVAEKNNNFGYYNGIPFSEASQLRFDYNTAWQVSTLTSGVDANNDGTRDSYQLYFEKDVVYTIRLEVTLGTMSEQIQRIERILESLNQDYLDIIKLTGTTPDDYRDYSFSRLLPDMLMDLIVQADELEKVSTFLKDTAQVASTYSGICDKLVALMDNMVEDEDSIAQNLETFKSYVGSLGTLLTDAKTQPLQVDYIMIQPSTAEPPKAKANFFQSLWHELRNFGASFTRDYDSMGAMDDGSASETISVWVPYGRDQANVLRNLTTNQFTPDYSIAVDLKLVNGGTLLPSILAGMGPDVYMGLDQGTVVNYAIRGALANIETIEYESVEKFEEAMYLEFNEAAMRVLGIADEDGDMHYYGLPETQDFPMMFIRMDVLADLDIEDVPTTWDDIYNLQSVLEGKNMEIGVTTDYRMFLYQMGGELFADEGMRINLDSQIGLASFEKMCNMFTQYSFPYTYNAANRFRSGEMPIIISSYTGLYNQLKVFATELDGCWTFVPLPGFEYIDENGDKQINNESISACSAVVMISGTENVKASWDFMRWQTGAECQVEYASEMVAIIGESAKHSTANREALESMPWTREEFEQVSAQFENLASIPNYPGSYILGRYTEFAFLSAYNDDADPREELLRYINTINNEITRKREEFSLETLEIGQTLADKRTSQALEAMDILAERHNAGDKYTALITAAKYAMANNKIDQIDAADAAFRAVLDADWQAAGSKTMEITKVSGLKVTVPEYYVNVAKQTALERNGGNYEISSLNEMQLVFFIAECLQDTADALESYK